MKTYEGQWAHDFKHGEGKETWEDGSYYKGNYFKGVFFGKGKYFSVKEKKVYEGDFEHGLPHG